MSKLLVSIILGSVLFSACRKDGYYPLPAAPTAKTNCILSTDNPAGRTYLQDSVVNYTCIENYCALLPINSRNYWIYEDSVFTDGVFTRVQYDTLQYKQQLISMKDGLVWWKSNISVGLPETMYVSDSSFFVMTARLFTPGYLDVKKEFGLFEGDSIKYLTSFDDYAATGRSLKLDAPFETSFGKYNSVLYFEKNARNFRRDQVYFRPGLGVIKYIREKAGSGFPRVVKLQQISTLVAYHIE